MSVFICNYIIAFTAAWYYGQLADWPPSLRATLHLCVDALDLGAKCPLSIDNLGTGDECHVVIDEKRGLAKAFSP